MMKKAPAFFLMLGVCFVSGCSSYEQEFDCPVGRGLSCASLSQVNGHINAGTLGEEQQDDLAPLEVSLTRGACAPGVPCQEFLPSEERTLLLYHPPQRLASGEVIPGRLVRSRGSS